MANCALEYFILNNWEFKNKNFMALCSSIRDEDNKAFYYRDFTEFDITLYFTNCILGARRYLLHEKDENLPKARLQFQRLKLLDKTVKFALISIVFYIVFVKFDAVDVTKQFFEIFKSTLSESLKFITE